MSIVSNGSQPVFNYTIQGNFYTGDEKEITQAGDDPLAIAVLERFRRAVEYRKTVPVYQNKSHETLLVEAHRQIHKVYAPGESQALQQEFKLDTPPIKYFDLAAQKTKALQFWLMNLVLTNIDSMFTVNPTSDPTLDASTISRVDNEVKRRLMAKLQASGNIQPDLLVGADKQVFREVKEFIDAEAANVIKAERDIIMGTAQGAADNIKAKMQDVVEEGDYATQYNLMLFDCVAYGIGYMRSPVMRNKVVRSFEGDKVVIKNKVVPTFQYVNAFSMYPVCDAPTLQDNTANIEYRYVNRNELQRLRMLPEYNKDAIDFILKHITERNQNWLVGGSSIYPLVGYDIAINTGRSPFSGVAILIHEGVFLGSDLIASGMTGLDEHATYNARVEICCNRTIRRELVKLPGGIDRTYFATPLQKIGEGILENVGLPALLLDSERTINRMMYNLQSNVDWSSRPPITYASTALEDGDGGLDSLRPGGAVKINNLIGIQGTGVAPVRQLDVVKPYFTMLQGQIVATIRLADDVCQLPGYVTGSIGYGQTTLGEYSQRVTNSGRFIQNIAMYQDVFFIRPMFRNLYYYILANYPEYTKGADIYPYIQGVTGLINKDQVNQIMNEVQTFVIQNPNNIYPKEMVDYAARAIAQRGGIPVDALGMDDPVLDAVGSNSEKSVSGQTYMPGSPQAPALDGRSAPAIPNTMAPNGTPASAPPPNLTGGST